MRTSRIGRVCAAVALSCTLLAAGAAAETVPTVPAPSTEGDSAPASRDDPAAIAELKSHLDASDHRAALQALHLALTQLSDGATYVWGRSTRRLVGIIKPTLTFRDGDGRVCRHLIYTLSVGTYSKTVEGIACRQPDRVWTLSG